MVLVRSYRARDQHAVKQLLGGLSELYPGADGWLDRRLNDVLENRARCLVADADGDLVGALIQTPKGLRMKLSSIFVKDGFRRHGVGSMLVQAAATQWSLENWKELYITVAEEHTAAVSALLEPFGFSAAGVVIDRYGPGRHETVLTARPQRHVMAVTPDNAARLYDGLVRHELRRTHLNIAPGSLVLIYETKPVGMLTGSFVAGQVKHGDGAQLVRIEHGQRRREAALKTLGAGPSSAVQVLGARRYETPLDISHVGMARPPANVRRITG